MSSSKSLPSSGSESEIEKITDFEKLARNHTLLNRQNQKFQLPYGRKSVSDLASSNYVATNGVNGRIGNKTWCKCECCAPMETSIEGIELAYKLLRFASEDF